MHDAIWLAVGLGMLLGGGDLLVRGASGIARAFGISPLVIGLTVISFGTSAPELSVNVLAASRGRGEISFGNVTGSNLANIGLVLGLTAMLRPLRIEGRLIRREIPLLVLATAAVAWVELVQDADSINRAQGVALLVGFAFFLLMVVRDVLRGRSDPLLAEAEHAAAGGRRRTLADAVLTAAGLGALLYGGDVTVSSATVLARSLGMSESAIALSLVAVGTSLPELATSAIAAIKGESDLAVGNVVGSNIFNLLFVLGTTAVVAPVPIPDVGRFDIVAVLAMTCLLFPFSLTQRRLLRAEGAFLLVSYVGYVAWRVGQ